MTVSLDAGRLAELCAKRHVPGAVLGVLDRDRVTTVEYGTVNQRTGMPVTADTVFQVGSITKPWTATLVMMLVDEGVVDLDEPIRTYLPDFRVSDDDASGLITLRHLLCHTSGISGDHFVDTGRGDDCLERYVESCAELGQEAAPGAMMSYCNAGFSIAGRVTEVRSGSTWDKFLRKRLVKPLGVATVGTLPEQALLHHTAAGHLGLPGAEPVPTPVWAMFGRCVGPAGNIHSSAPDLLRFARFHLDGGVAPDGTRLLSAAAVAAMQEPQVEVADRWSLGTHWGLGWSLYRDAAPGWGHNGDSATQFAFLRVFPDHKLAVCLLTNGGHAGAVWRELLAEVAHDAADLEIPPMPRPSDPPDPAVVPADLSPYLGHFERLHVAVDVVCAEPDDPSAGLVARIERSGPLGAILPADARVQRQPLVPVDRSLFLCEAPGAPAPTPFVFCDFDGPMPRRAQHGLRVVTRC